MELGCRCSLYLDQSFAAILVLAGVFPVVFAVAARIRNSGMTHHVNAFMAYFSVAPHTVQNGEEHLEHLGLD
jgi:hypothetical protein